MTPAWCSYEEAAQHLGISRDTLDVLVADSTRFGIKAPLVDYGTPKKACIKFCIARLDAWAMEVGECRRSESSRAASGKSDGTTPTGLRVATPSRRSKRGTRSTPTSSTASKPGSATTQEPNGFAFLSLVKP